MKLLTVASLASIAAVLTCLPASTQDRMPPIPPEAQTPAQKSASAEFERTRKSPVFGPFTPLLRSPELMLAAKNMGDYLRFKSALPPRLSEFAILLTAAEWRQGVEWQIHKPIALQNGVSEATVAAIAAGRRPKALSPEEAMVYDFLTELNRTHQVSDSTYARARQAFGERGVVDLTGIAGYYTLLAMTLNVARTPTTGPVPELQARH